MFWSDTTLDNVSDSVRSVINYVKYRHEIMKILTTKELENWMIKEKETQVIKGNFSVESFNLSCLTIMEFLRDGKITAAFDCHINIMSGINNNKKLVYELMKDQVLQTQPVIGKITSIAKQQPSIAKSTESKKNLTETQEWMLKQFPNCDTMNDGKEPSVCVYYDFFNGNYYSVWKHFNSITENVISEIIANIEKIRKTPLNSNQLWISETLLKSSNKMKLINLKDCSNLIREEIRYKELLELLLKDPGKVSVQLYLDIGSIKENDQFFEISRKQMIDRIRMLTIKSSLASDVM